MTGGVSARESPRPGRGVEPPLGSPNTDRREGHDVVSAPVANQSDSTGHPSWLPRVNPNGLRAFFAKWSEPLRTMNLKSSSAFQEFLLGVIHASERMAINHLAEQRTTEEWHRARGLEPPLADLAANLLRHLVGHRVEQLRILGHHEAATEAEGHAERLVDILRHPAPGDISTDRHPRGPRLNVHKRAAAAVLARHIRARSGAYPSPAPIWTARTRSKPGRPSEAEAEQRRLEEGERRMQHRLKRARWDCFARLSGVIAEAIQNGAALNWKAKPLTRRVLLAVLKNLADEEHARGIRNTPRHRAKSFDARATLVRHRH